MASYYFNPQQHHQPSSTSSHSSSSSHNHHGGRSRRAPRLAASQNPHKQFRGVRSPRDLVESPAAAAARAKFEAGRSFDLDDDLEFCPGLLTEDDVSIPPSSKSEDRLTRGSLANCSALKQLQSMHSSSSDGSLSSGSPHSSPVQTQIQPSQQVTPSFSLSSASSANYNPATGYQSTNHHHHHQMNIHQPAALRTRNAIPIVNPSTGMRLPSPPSSVSPAMMQQHQPTYQRRW